MLAGARWAGVLGDAWWACLLGLPLSCFVCHFPKRFLSPEALISLPLVLPSSAFFIFHSCRTFFLTLEAGLDGGLGIVGMWLVDTDLRGGENRVSGEAGGPGVAEERGMTVWKCFLLEGIQRDPSILSLSSPPLRSPS